MEEIAGETSKRGATMMNIMPLIPSHNFADKRPPTCKELDGAPGKSEQVSGSVQGVSNARLTREVFQGVSEGIKTFCDAPLVGSLGRPNSTLARLIPRGRAFRLEKFISPHIVL
jgi:hypothetical protein